MKAQPSARQHMLNSRFVLIAGHSHHELVAIVSDRIKELPKLLNGQIPYCLARNAQSKDVSGDVARMVDSSASMARQWQVALEAVGLAFTIYLHRKLLHRPK